MRDSKERGILFSGPMVRALLDGRKTQTRRIVKPQPAPGEFIRDDGHGSAYYSTDAESTGGLGIPTDRGTFECPYGVTGDRLWVRETVRWDAELGRGVYAADDAISVIDGWPWKRKVLPSLFLPRGASRITLEISSVHVERLQEIAKSPEDARAEGFPLPDPVRTELVVRDMTADPPVTTREKASVVFGDPVMAFHAYWLSLHGADAWEKNPLVWVISFRQVERTTRW